MLKGYLKLLYSCLVNLFNVVNNIIKESLCVYYTLKESVLAIERIN